MGGGVFLLFKSTQEIHLEMEKKEKISNEQQKEKKISWVIFQIGILDILFSLDSIFTAIGLAFQYWVMAIAIFIAILTMLLLSEPLSLFIEKNPTIKMLALSFLLLVGVALIADSLHHHIPKGYIYFAICFSTFVEFLNCLVRVASRKYPAKK
jgi:predicted tellurium resistance membrane protein TerC